MGLIHGVTRSNHICCSPSETAPGLQEEPISGSALATATSHQSAIFNMHKKEKRRTGPYISLASYIKSPMKLDLKFVLYVGPLKPIALLEATHT